MVWSGRYSTPIIAHAPGSTPLQYGNNIIKRGLVFDKASGQSEANAIAGYVLAEANQGWKGIPFLFQGNHRYLDIAPQGWLEVSLSAQDSKRGIVWVDNAVRAAHGQHDLRSRDRAPAVNGSMDAEAAGESGVTGDYTVPPGIRQTRSLCPGSSRAGTAWPTWEPRTGWFHLLPASIYWERSTPKGSPFSETQDLTVNAVDFDLSGWRTGYCGRSSPPTRACSAPTSTPAPCPSPGPSGRSVIRPTVGTTPNH